MITIRKPNKVTKINLKGQDEPTYKTKEGTIVTSNTIDMNIFDGLFLAHKIGVNNTIKKDAIVKF